MKLTIKVVLGVIALLPLLTTAILISSLIYLFRMDARSFVLLLTSIHPVVLLILNLGILLVSTTPKIFYVIHAGRNPELGNRKPAWILLLLFIGAVATPLYWYNFIWQDSYYENS